MFISVRFLPVVTCSVLRNVKSFLCAHDEKK